MSILARMMDPIPGDNEGFVALLLDRVRGLRMRVGSDRVQHFDSLCAFAVRRVPAQIRPETCISTLLRLAERGGVPTAAANAIIDRTFAEAGLLPLRQVAIDQSAANLVNADR